MLDFNSTLEESKAPEIGSLYAIYGKNINGEISVLIVGDYLPANVLSKDKQIPVISLDHPLHRSGAFPAKTPANFVAEVFNIEPHGAHYIFNYNDFIVTFQLSREGD